jgi:hypothetical protein
MSDPEQTEPSNKVLYPTSKLSIAALILGILTLWPLRIIAAIPAIACGHLALRDIKASNGNKADSAYAWFGLIIGYLDVILLVAAAIALPILAHNVQESFRQLESSQSSH